MRIADREISCATVLGFGRTGRAVTEFLLSRGVEPFVSDLSTLSECDHALLAVRGVLYEEKGHTQAGLAHADLVVLSPGVSPGLPLLVEARQSGIPVLSELDLAYQACPAVPIIAVTGTNGKSTTVTLIETLLHKGGIKVIVAGNIGTPFIAVVDQASACDAIVLEVSSFQLEQSTLFHPQVAVLLNLTADHLSRHKTMINYTAAKGRLFLNQMCKDTAVLPSDLVETFPEIRARRVLFNRLDCSRFPFIEELPPHQRENLQAAIAARFALFPNFGSLPVCLEDLQSAFCLPFRMYEEGEIKGTRVVNDSKSTNAASTAAALASVTEPLVLILGGRHKEEGYDALAQAIATRSVRQTILFGEAASFLQSVLRAAGYTRLKVCRNLKEAIRVALTASLPGDVLLFSPACSSYDQYQDYLQRGEAFSHLIRSHPSFTSTQQRR